MMAHYLQGKIQAEHGERYPAAVQECDARTPEPVGARKVASDLKQGDYSFDEARFALLAFRCRVSRKIPALIHSDISQIALEGVRFAQRNRGDIIAGTEHPEGDPGQR
ncbi:hypothetical protein [Enterobacter mori]|uniref:hypothetical protein n=1 Tax=Enterobacter mori TaxID=539813 RepID=UPI0011787869|nr:hypothetical protein [Enterobacter mori]CAH8250000.1 Uncharacterised protein [Enterobacter ludwigii]